MAEKNNDLMNDILRSFFSNEEHLTLEDMREKPYEIHDLVDDILFAELLVLKFFEENREYLDDFPIDAYAGMVQEGCDMILQANGVLYLHILKETVKNA